MANRDRRNLVWDRLIAKGESPYDFCAQTSNGSARAGDCPGWNRSQPGKPAPEVAATDVWAKANRSAE